MATGTIAAHAQQQPGVELYGQVGVGLNSRSNQATAAGAPVGTTIDISNNALAVSFWGLRGREDLGGGLATIFRLESTVQTDTGVGGKPVAGLLFDRQSYVGLTGKNWGAVTLGRQFHALTDRTIRTTDVYQVGGQNAHVVPLVFVGVDRFQGNDNRVNNSVKYRFDQPSGVQFGASYGFGEVSGSTTKGSSYSFDVAHVGANYSVGGGYIRFNAPAAIAGTGNTPKHELWSIGGSTTFGSVQTYLAYYDSRIEATAATLGVQGNKIAHVGVAWQAAPAIMVKAAYYHDKGSTLNGVAGRDGTKNTYIASAEYSLSKRTSVYAAMANNRLADGYMKEPIFTAALGRDPSASSVLATSVGMLHKF